MGNTLNEDLKGQAVIIAAKYLQPKYADAHLRVFRVRGGFGASPVTQGSALFGTFLADDELCRMEGWQVERLATLAEITVAVAVRKGRELITARTRDPNETQTTPKWRVGDEMLTPAGMLQLFLGNTDVGCLEKPHADAIVRRLNRHDALVKALERYQEENNRCWCHEDVDDFTCTHCQARIALDAMKRRTVEVKEGS